MTWSWSSKVIKIYLSIKHMMQKRESTHIYESQTILMQKYLILLFLILSCVNATPAAHEVIVDEKKVKITDFKMSYYIDTTETMSFDDIKKQVFTNASNKITLGKKVNVTWAKVIITNDTDENKKIFLHNPSAYSAKAVEFYELENKKLINSEKIDLKKEEGTLKMHGANALFGINLDAHQTKTIYMKYHTFAYQYFTLLIYDENYSKRVLINDRIDIALLIGFLLTLALYNMVLFISSGYKENLYYSLFLASASVWIALLYGLIANLFHIYGDKAYQLHLFAMTLAPLLVLFFMNLFETKKKYKTEHKFLASVALLNVADFLFGIFNIFKAMEIFSILTMYTLVVFMWVSISIYRKGNVLAKLFLIGHSFFALFSAIGISFFLGFSEFNYVTRHATGIGYSIEALMLAYIISYKIKLLENKKEELLTTLEHKVEERTKELKHLASIDPMTNLYNRRYFTEVSQSVLDLAKRDKSEISIMLLDIDHFKNVNDSYGHKVGDDALNKLAKIFQDISRESDIVSRWGGEEFVILLPETNMDGALTLSEKIRTEVEKSVILLEDGRELSLTVSIGISQVNYQEDISLEASIHRADEALYEAKASGRNRVCLASYSNLGQIETK